MEGSQETIVIVYSTPTCPYCNIAKGYFTNKGVKFVDYDVSQNREKGMEMIKKSGQTGIPVLDINGKIIVGFDKDAIDAALSNEMQASEAKTSLFNDPTSQ